jgi:TatD DNase family protein
VIDTHTHVTSCRDGAADVLARARAAGVSSFITIGSSLEEMPAAAAVVREHADVSMTAGIHPHAAETWSASTEAVVRAHAALPRCVAIGETGLDWFRMRAPREAQVTAFRAQLAIARELDLPVVIHCREADEDCFAILRGEAPPVVVLHCFAAAGHLAEAVERGWYCSFAGNVTYPSAIALQDAAARVPAHLLLAETDAPYLSPVPHRGRPNEPAHVVETVAYLARLRGVTADVLAEQIEANARAAFRLP